MENEKDYQPDILNFLEKIVQRNTIAYKEDFDVDKEILWNSAQESSLEHRSFLWMSRPCGTWCNTAIRTSIFAKAAMKHSFTAYCGWRKTHTTFDMYRNVKRNCSAFYRWSTRWKSRISALDGQNLLPCSGNGISTACGADLASMSFVKRPLLGVNP